MPVEENHTVILVLEKIFRWCWTPGTLAEIVDESYSILFKWYRC